MSIKNNRGFTLIELLVVIAIIGILASVVLASLNTARAKGADAAIKANLAGMRAEAELYYDNSGSYGTVAANCVVSTSASMTGTGCGSTNITSDNNLMNALYAATSASGNTGLINVGVSPAAWAAAVPLKTNNALYQCVDASGTSKVVTTALSTNTVCPAS